MVITHGHFLFFLRLKTSRAMGNGLRYILLLAPKQSKLALICANQRRKQPFVKMTEVPLRTNGDVEPC